MKSICLCRLPCLIQPEMLNYTVLSDLGLHIGLHRKEYIFLTEMDDMLVIIKETRGGYTHLWNIVCHLLL